MTALRFTRALVLSLDPGTRATICVDGLTVPVAATLGESFTDSDGVNFLFSACPSPQRSETRKASGDVSCLALLMKMTQGTFGALRTIQPSPWLL
jgi:hypothetical protein